MESFGDKVKDVKKKKIMSVGRNLHKEDGDYVYVIRTEEDRAVIRAKNKKKAIEEFMRW